MRSLLHHIERKYILTSDFHIDSRGIRSDEAFIDVYFDEVPADFFEIWDPEDNTKGEFHIKYYSVRLPDGKEKIRYQIWGGPVEGNNLSSETLESIKTVYLSALRDSENELKPTRSGKLANLLSSIVNTDEAKEQILAAVKLANANIEGQQSVVQLQNIINTNLSVLEQDLLRQKVGVGLVEPKFESIAASLRAWLRPRWIYIKSDNPILEKVKVSTLTMNGEELLILIQKGYLLTFGQLKARLLQMKSKKLCQLN